MASAYKSALKSGTTSDSDESMSDFSDQLSNSEQDDSAESDTDEQPTAPAKKNKATIADLPVELRNRILMLTSRGVSFRYIS